MSYYIRRMPYGRFQFTERYHPIGFRAIDGGSGSLNSSAA